jgi:iron complex transport system permease protein
MTLRTWARPCLAIAVGGAVFLVCVRVGSVAIGWGDIVAVLSRAWDGQAPEGLGTILFQIRVPRVVMAALVGALLASVGGALQPLLRNPLADPYLLGISGGAALGAVLGLFFGVRWPAPLACLGAAMSLGLVLALSRVQSTTSVSMVILAGAAIHSLSSALITLVLSQVSQRYETSSILFWLLGSLDTVPYRALVPLAAFSVVGLGVLFLAAPTLNLLAQGEEAALSLGLPVEKAKALLITLCAGLVGLAVTFNGMIPFVGLVVPHMARLIFGPDHRVTLPLTALMGAVLVMAADALGRALLAPQEIPTGVVTALGGAPFFLYILRRERKKLL